jgi:hypothetical protein
MASPAVFPLYFQQTSDQHPQVNEQIGHDTASVTQFPPHQANGG